VTATNELAFLVRKLGGWSFHELNVPLSDLKKFTRDGPDLSYDFFTRAQCLHALLTGDATVLRLAFRWLLQAGIQPVGLVHDLQNHDEITYQLVELDFRKDETLSLRGEKVTAKELKERILREMREKAAGPVAPNNKLYRPEKDGVATTFAGFVAAALQVRDPYHVTASEREQIRRGHLLLAMANAMQPGVFSLSSWDLVGALPLPEETVAEWVEDGDYRWVNRGGVDLLGANPEATKSVACLPRAVALYGPLPEQLKDPDSFASRLKRLLAARKAHRIAEAELVAVPPVKNAGVCVLVMRLPEGRGLAITALNFSRSPAREEIELGQVPGGTAEAVRGREVIVIPPGAFTGKVGASGRLAIALEPWDGRTFVIRTASR
jgi:trehalose synthase